MTDHHTCASGHRLKDVATRLVLLSGVITWSCAHDLFARLAGSDDFLVRAALGGMAGSTLLLPFLLCVRPVFGRWRLRNPDLILLSGAALLLPFVYLSTLGNPSLGTALPGKWLVAAVALILAASAEEIVFRLYFLDTLSFCGRPYIGIGLSSLLFAVAHSANPGAEPLAVVNIGLFGVLLCLLRMASGGIIAPILVHYGWNLTTGMVLGWRVSGFRLPSVLSQRTPLWAGFGPESSPVLTVCLLALSWALAMGLYSDRRGTEKSA